MNDLPSEVDSTAFQLYLYAQVGQVKDLRQGQVLSNGQLEHFRAALKIKEAHESDWTSVVEEAYGAPMFSNLEDIEELEDQLRNGDFHEFIAQCCAVTELYMQFNPMAKSLFRTRDEGAFWLFDHIQTLTDVAVRRAQLEFPAPSFSFRRTRNASMIHAVRSVIEGNEPSITWQEILMLFRVSDPEDVGRLLLRLGAIIEKIAGTIPKPALSLLLCHIADGVLVGAANIGSQNLQRVILKLLECGASPMVSSDSLCVLLKLIERNLDLTETPWWLVGEQPTSERTGHLLPTILNRLLSFKWPDEFLKQLRKYSCCSLDATGGCKKRFGVKMASLQCLAAQNITRFQLDELSPYDKLIVSKHIAVDIFLSTSVDL